MILPFLDRMRAEKVLRSVLSRDAVEGPEAHALIDEVEPKLPLLAEHLSREQYSRCLFVLVRAAGSSERTDFFQRNYEPVREMLLSLAAGDPDMLVALGVIENDLGKLAAERADLATAMVHFRRSLECDERTGDLPGRQDSLFNLGVALRFSGAFAEAVACFDCAIAEFEPAVAAGFDRWETGLDRLALLHAERTAALSGLSP